MAKRPMRMTRLAAEMSSQLNLEGAAMLGQRGPGRYERETLPPDDRPRYKTFVPLDDQVAVHALKVEKTEGGLALPDGVSDPFKSPRGLVIAVGPNCKQIKEGQILVIPGVTNGLLLAHGGSGSVMLFKESALLCGIELPQDEIQENRAEALKAADEAKRALEESDRLARQ